MLYGLIWPNFDRMFILTFQSYWKKDSIHPVPASRTNCLVSTGDAGSCCQMPKESPRLWLKVGSEWRRWPRTLPNPTLEWSAVLSAGVLPGKFPKQNESAVCLFTSSKKLLDWHQANPGTQDAILPKNFRAELAVHYICLLCRHA